MLLVILESKPGLRQGEQSIVQEATRMVRAQLTNVSGHYLLTTHKYDTWPSMEWSAAHKQQKFVKILFCYEV